MHRSLAAEVRERMIRDAPGHQPLPTAGNRIIQGLLFVGGARLRAAEVAGLARRFAGISPASAQDSRARAVARSL